MAVTAATFRKHLPEFTDATRYPNSVVDYWITISQSVINTARWGVLSDVGAEMFIAHNVVLERRAMDESDNGAVPGISKGPINSESVDKVSVGYDTAGGSEMDAGHWNETIYGRRYIRQARKMGAGPLQVGIDCTQGGPGAWPGPWTGLGPNQNQ